MFLTEFRSFLNPVRGGAGIRRFATVKLLPNPATQLNTNKETQGDQPWVTLFVEVPGIEPGSVQASS
jgi:hypothetical protein